MGLLHGDVQAQTSLSGSGCLDRSRLVTALKRHGELQRVEALGSNGLLYEFWIGDGDKPSWTMIITSTDGVSCVIGYGNEWGITAHEHKHGGREL